MTELMLTPNGNHCLTFERQRRAAVRLLGDLAPCYQRGRGQLDQVWWFGRIRTISVYHVDLMLDRRFEPGTLLTITLRGEVTDFSRNLEACVVQVNRNPNEGWVVRCVFAGQLSESEL